MDAAIHDAPNQLATLAVSMPAAIQFAGTMYGPLEQ